MRKGLLAATCKLGSDGKSKVGKRKLRVKEATIFCPTAAKERLEQQHNSSSIDSMKKLN
jgi:hypothetical protein